MDEGREGPARAFPSTKPLLFEASTEAALARFGLGLQPWTFLRDIWRRDGRLRQLARTTEAE